MSAQSQITALLARRSGTRALATKENPFFRMRRKFRSAAFDVSGHWSYPALVTNGSELCWLHIVLGTAPMPNARKTALFRPKAVVITKAESAIVVSYQNLHFTNDPFKSLAWERPIAMFPHEGIARLTYQSFSEREHALLAKYTKIGKLFSSQRRLPQSFRDEYLDLIHPVFLGFLKHLAPAFIAALGASEMNAAAGKS